MQLKMFPFQPCFCASDSLPETEDVHVDSKTAKHQRPSNLLIPSASSKRHRMGNSQCQQPTGSFDSGSEYLASPHETVELRQAFIVCLQLHLIFTYMYAITILKVYFVF